MTQNDTVGWTWDILWQWCRVTLRLEQAGRETWLAGLIPPVPTVGGLDLYQFLSITLWFNYMSQRIDESVLKYFEFVKFYRKFFILLELLCKIFWTTFRFFSFPFKCNSGTLEDWMVNLFWPWHCVLRLTQLSIMGLNPFGTLTKCKLLL